VASRLIPASPPNWQWAVALLQNPSLCYPQVLQQLTPANPAASIEAKRVEVAWRRGTTCRKPLAPLNVEPAGMRLLGANPTQPGLTRPTVRGTTVRGSEQASALTDPIGHQHACARLHRLGGSGSPREAYFYEGTGDRQPSEDPTAKRLKLACAGA